MESNISIDDILQSSAIGSQDKAIANNLFGFNHAQTPSAVASNREQQGFLFFVRPQLNLQLDNIRNSRKFMPLGADQGIYPNSDGDTTVHRFIRTTLDPRLMVGYKFGGDANRTGTDIPPIKSPLTNNNMAFIPILTNNATTSSGWPDPVVPIYTSKTGRYNESTFFVDGLTENYETYDIDVTFRNTVMDPILYLFYMWSFYSSYVFTGRFVPYPDFITDNKIDYNTRIYRVRLDRNRYRVTKIMSTGPAIVTNCSVGQFGDMNVEDVFSSANKEISMRFKCLGFEIFDEILIYEFNTTTSMFKPEMKDENRDTYMVLVPRNLNHVFQHRAYPRINPGTHVMEWWVDKALFDVRAQAFIQQVNEQDAIQASFDNRNLISI